MKKAKGALLRVSNRLRRPGRSGGSSSVSKSLQQEGTTYVQCADVTLVQKLTSLPS